MKIAILMQTWNKNKELSNVLRSIKDQVSNYPYDVCIWDDFSDIDPEPIIRKFFPKARYQRADKWYPLDLIGPYSVDLIPKNADVVIMCSSDVIWGSDNTLNQLSENVGKKKIAMAKVRNAIVDPYLYKISGMKFNEGAIRALMAKKIKHGKRCWPGNRQWYFFLGAIRREDLFRLDVKKPFCDVVLQHRMVKLGFKVVFPGAIGIHQNHPKIFHKCSSVDICPLHCSMKEARRIEK